MKAMLKRIMSALEIDDDTKLQTFEKKIKKKTLLLIRDEIYLFFNLQEMVLIACENLADDKETLSA